MSRRFSSPRSSWSRKRTLLLILPAVLCLSTGVSSFAQLQKEEDADALARRIETLIKGLDDDDFKVREESEKALIEIGHPAFHAVQKATQSNSAEVRFRAERLLKKIPLFEKVYYIDLQPKANHKLGEMFHLSKDRSVPDNNLTDLSRGEQVLGNVKFEIGQECIQLAGKLVADKPTRVEGIQVNKAFKALHILHATGYGAYGTKGDDRGYFVEDGTLIGEYILHYQEGKKVSIPIIYGEQVRDWWNWDDSKKIKDENSSVVWTGSNDFSRQNGVQLRLFRTAWKNPYPDRKVLSIDYISTKTTAAAPFCIALSAELE